MRHARLAASEVWVVADLHLPPDDDAEARRFAAQLAELPDSCEALVVLGDLVDAWAGPGSWREPGYQPLLEALSRLPERGIACWLLRGNRDVLMEPPDLAGFGGHLADSLLLELGSRRLLLSHGDEYCLRDRPYQRLRRSLRFRPLRWLLRALPYRLRRRLAQRMRGLSREAVARKPLDAMALVDQAVVSALARHGAEEALIGHLHRAERRPLGPERALRVLPAWGPQRPPEPI